MKKSVKKYTLTYIGLVIAATSLMFLVTLLHSNTMKTNVEQSLKMTPPDYYTYMPPFNAGSGFRDNITEGTMLKECLPDWQYTLADNAMVLGYPRYWHGYLVFLKPLMMIMDLRGVYMVNSIVFYTLGLVYLYMLAKKTKPLYALIIAMAFIPAHFYVIPNCMTYVNVFINAFITSIILLKKDRDDTFISYLLFISGCITSFIDFLTAPLLTLLIPLITITHIRHDSFSKRSILKMVKWSILWAIGYGGFWAAKWALATALTGINVFQDAFSALQYRSWGGIQHGLLV